MASVWHTPEATILTSTSFGRKSSSSSASMVRGCCGTRATAAVTCMVMPFLADVLIVDSERVLLVGLLHGDPLEIRELVDDGPAIEPAVAAVFHAAVRSLGFVLNGRP